VGAQLGELFWNSRIRSWATVPDLKLPPVVPPLDALRLYKLTVDDATGAVAGGDRIREAVTTAGNPFFQIAGTRVRQLGDRQLVRVAQPARMTWLARGLDIDGAVLEGREPRLFAFGERPGQRVEVLLQIEPVPTGETRIEIDFGQLRRVIRLKPAETQTVRFPGCTPFSGRIRALGALRLEDSRAAAATLAGAEIRPVSGPPCR
jgi:hypothetical protein